MATPLVTLAQAKAHLRITTPDGDPADADLWMKLEQAEAIILDRINTSPYMRDITVTWTPATVPLMAHAAILIKCGELWRFRGDDLADEGPAATEDGELSPVIRTLLRRLCEQVIA